MSIYIIIAVVVLIIILLIQVLSQNTRKNNLINQNEELKDRIYDLKNIDLNHSIQKLRNQNLSEKAKEKLDIIYKRFQKKYLDEIIQSENDVELISGRIQHKNYKNASDIIKQVKEDLEQIKKDAEVIKFDLKALEKEENERRKMYSSLANKLEYDKKQINQKRDLISKKAYQKFMDKHDLISQNIEELNSINLITETEKANELANKILLQINKNKETLFFVSSVFQKINNEIQENLNKIKSEKERLLKEGYNLDNLQINKTIENIDKTIDEIIAKLDKHDTSPLDNELKLINEIINKLSNRLEIEITAKKNIDKEKEKFDSFYNDAELAVNNYKKYRKRYVQVGAKREIIKLLDMTSDRIKELEKENKENHKDYIQKTKPFSIIYKTLKEQISEISMLKNKINDEERTLQSLEQQEKEIIKNFENAKEILNKTIIHFENLDLPIISDDYYILKTNIIKSKKEIEEKIKENEYSKEELIKITTNFIKQVNQISQETIKKENLNNKAKKAILLFNRHINSIEDRGKQKLITTYYKNGKYEEVLNRIFEFLDEKEIKHDLSR